MKTLTVTWSSYNNYGTLLQAYALQNIIWQLGHDNVILSDKLILNEYFSQTGHSPGILPEILGANTLHARIRRLINNPGRLYRKMIYKLNPEMYQKPFADSRVACDAFRKDCLRIRYGITSEKLELLNDEYDAFVCGSDQIWSTFDQLFNPFYYLNFSQKRKIAYAPSLGTDKIPQDIALQIKAFLEDFSSISVREEISANQLSDILDQPVSCVADPTLLHDRVFWEHLVAEIPTKHNEYILCYFLESNPWYFDYALHIARKLKFPLLLVPNKWEHLQMSFIAKHGVGPKEFVALFRDAKYVLTDSYHGSIFSVLFEKEFLYLQRFSDDALYSQNIRIQSLFNKLGLTSRIVAQGSLPQETAAIDYEKTTAKVEKYRTESILFLSDSLTEKN